MSEMGINGYVIGGPGHGQYYNPDRVGSVLVVPKPQKIPEFGYSDDPVEPVSAAYERVEYALHQFSDYEGPFIVKHRVWMPVEVKKGDAFRFLIDTALRAPADGSIK